MHPRSHIVPFAAFLCERTGNGIEAQYLQISRTRIRLSNAGSLASELKGKPEITFFFRKLKLEI
jgi:hypothetical protein